MMLAHKNKANVYSSTKVQKNALLKDFIEIDYRRVNLIKAINYNAFFRKRLSVISEAVRVFQQNGEVANLEVEKIKKTDVSVNQKGHLVF